MLAKCNNCGWMTKFPFQVKWKFKTCPQCKRSLIQIYTSQGERFLENKYNMEKFDTKDQQDFKKQKLLKIAKEKGFINNFDSSKIWKNEFIRMKCLKELIKDGYLKDSGILGKFIYIEK